MANINELFALILTLGLLYFLSKIAFLLRQAATLLKSVDDELFHIAQELNPHYGLCGSCGRRTYVRHVVRQDQSADQFAPDVFFCSRCWWLSDSMTTGDETKHYKDRFTEDDRQAGLVGPGSAE